MHKNTVRSVLHGIVPKLDVLQKSDFSHVVV